MSKFLTSKYQSLAQWHQWMVRIGSSLHGLSDSLPLALKWSLVIAAFVSLVMGALGSYLISKQEESFREQSNMLGQVLADQLASSASEPLLADDTLTLDMLVSQQKKHQMISGMQIYTRKGRLKASAGNAVKAKIMDLFKAVENDQTVVLLPANQNNISFYSKIKFNGVDVGMVVVSIDNGPMEEHLAALKKVLIMTTLGLILLGAFLAIPLAYRLARPIDELVKVGEALGAATGNDESSAGRDAINRLYRTFGNVGEQLDKKKLVENALSRHLSESIAKEVMDAPDGVKLGGNLLEGSVLFCDIVGFTEMSENMSPHDVADLLNQYFSHFSMAAEACKGTVDKFIGDCIMILFGVPEPDTNHGLEALTCAILIREMAKRINLKREQESQKIVTFRLGVNSGEMLAGNLGSESRMQFTVVGDVVNLAARMCSICEPGEVLATEAVMNHPSVIGYVDAAPGIPVSVKGRQRMVTPYTIRLHNFEDISVIVEMLNRLLPGGQSRYQGSDS